MPRGLECRDRNACLLIGDHVAEVEPTNQLREQMLTELVQERVPRPLEDGDRADNSCATSRAESVSHARSVDCRSPELRLCSVDVVHGCTHDERSVHYGAVRRIVEVRLAVEWCLVSDESHAACPLCLVCCRTSIAPEQAQEKAGVRKRVEDAQRPGKGRGRKGSGAGTCVAGGSVQGSVEGIQKAGRGLRGAGCGRP